MFDKNLLLVFFAIILLWLMLNPFMESFDASTTEFVPVGHPRYGLRGDRLCTRPIAGNYISANRHIRLNPSGGEMYQSSTPPGCGCNQVACPSSHNEYDELDTCWQCGNK